MTAQAVPEHHSNGLGGGRWTDADTWRGGKVPTEDVHVVITAGDTVVYDGGDASSMTCRALSLDPGGVLTFRMDGRTHRLRVAGPVHSFGTIRVDATRERASIAILELASDQVEERRLHLRDGSSLLLYGARRSRDGDANVKLISRQGASSEHGILDTSGNVMIDLQQATVSAMQCRLSDIDNTGYQPAQRLNIVNSRFKEGARLILERCDTPNVSGNRFSAPGSSSAAVAITLEECHLATIRENVVHGYPTGLLARRDVDPSITANSMESVGTGLRLVETRNSMLNNNRISKADRGIIADRTDGAMDGLYLTSVQTGIVLRETSFQCLNVFFDERPSRSVPLLLQSASATLVNADIPIDAIQLEGNRPHGSAWVETLYYALVRVKGNLPERAVVQISTAAVSGGVPASGADMNVRNSPARLSEAGWTPLPRTRRALMLRGPSINAQREKRNAPFYDLKVLPVVDSPDAATGTLHSQVVEPDSTWFRREPDAMQATLEVTLP